MDAVGHTTLGSLGKGGGGIWGRWGSRVGPAGSGCGGMGWKEIRKAETDNVLYHKLMIKDKANRILHRKNRKDLPNSLHENIEAHEVFINDPESVSI